jgi:hypothetical protein
LAIGSSLVQAIAAAAGVATAFGSSRLPRLSIIFGQASYSKFISGQASYSKLLQGQASYSKFIRGQASYSKLLQGQVSYSRIIEGTASTLSEEAE